MRASHDSCLRRLPEHAVSIKLWSSGCLVLTCRGKSCSQQSNANSCLSIREDRTAARALPTAEDHDAAIHHAPFLSTLLVTNSFWAWLALYPKAIMQDSGSATMGRVHGHRIVELLHIMASYPTSVVWSRSWWFPWYWHVVDRVSRSRRSRRRPVCSSGARCVQDSVATW